MSNDKTATERLRELLDEHNIEYGWDSNSIYWDANNGVPWTADLYFGSNLSLFSPRCTPEQVIEATLGRGTCHCTTPDDAWCFACSACGKSFPRSELNIAHNHGEINYCPNCGAKVVD